MRSVTLCPIGVDEFFVLFAVELPRLVCDCDQLLISFGHEVEQSRVVLIDGLVFCIGDDDDEVACCPEVVNLHVLVAADLNEYRSWFAYPAMSMRYCRRPDGVIKDNWYSLWIAF
jgi:hypothetical protein